MKLISWNVNGLRACVQKGFLEYFQQVDADVFCIQAVSYTHLCKVWVKNIFCYGR